MHLPRRGEIAAYIAKQFDVPFGAEQRKIARLKEGASTFETANEVAKLLVKRLNQLMCPDDDSSPADVVESKLGKPSYRLFLNESKPYDSLEFIWRDGAKYFQHHSEIARCISEKRVGAYSSANLDLEIYLYYFALPVFANNLVKYKFEKLTLILEDELSADGQWFLPSVKSGRQDCVTPLAKALSWLRIKLGGGSHELSHFLCPKSDPESAARQIEGWRCGDIIPSRERIDGWARTFHCDKMAFRKIFHLSAATTRMWRHLVQIGGYKLAIAINNHLADLMRALEKEHTLSGGRKPDFGGQSAKIRRCLGWLYNGPQAGPVSPGPNYQELVIEMQAAFVAASSPFD